MNEPSIWNKLIEVRQIKNKEVIRFRRQSFGVIVIKENEALPEHFKNRILKELNLSPSK